MKLRLSSFHVPIPFSSHASKLSRICAALILAASVAGQVQDAGAAPKTTPSPTPTPTPTATPTVAATPAATAAPSPAATPTYNGAQQSQYITTARDAFVALRTAKSQPFLDAHKALEDAGSIAAKGLKTKEDITARRDLLAKTMAANDEYLEFVKTQEATYRAELAKTPLIPSDIDGLVSEFAERANTAKTVKLRETEHDIEKAGDDMLAFLGKKFGAWSVSDAGKISFKKKSDITPMNDLALHYNAKVKESEALRAELKPAPSPSPSASVGGSPAASPTGAAPASSPAAAVPAASAKP